MLVEEMMNKETLTVITAKATSAQKLAAFLIMVVNLCIFVAILSNKSVAGPVIQPFLPMFVTAVVILDGLTAYLLFSQYRVNRVPSVAILAATFLYSCLISIPHILTFPTAFSEKGLLHASSQTAIWLWVFWHGGFPIGILSYLMADKIYGKRTLSTKASRNLFAILVTAVVAVVLLFTLITTRFSTYLPTILEKENYFKLITSGIGPVVFGLNFIAFVVLILKSRARTIAQLWLVVAVFAFLMDVTLTLISGMRFSIGWYVARLNSLISASSVLLSLLFEINNLYYKVAQQDKKMVHQAYHDSLTGLPNRKMFTEKLHASLNAAEQGQYLMSVLYLDLDGFKQINDGLGHDKGDALLIEVAQRLSSCVRPEDTLARMGGDEFTLILPKINSVEDSEKVAGRILESLREPFIIEGNRLLISTSIGISLFPTDSFDGKSLMKNADSAMYRSKENGKNRMTVYEA